MRFWQCWQQLKPYPTDCNQSAWHQFERLRRGRFGQVQTAVGLAYSAVNRQTVAVWEVVNSSKTRDLLVLLTSYFGQI
jgi:hypothetical protein